MPTLPTHLSRPLDPTESSCQTRARLLDTAERLFAEKGFPATSVRQITHQASSNLAAVNYHFGSKTNLYRAVFERRLKALRTSRLDAVDRTLAEGPAASLEDLLRGFANAFLEPFVATDGGRLWIRLYLREMLDPRLPPDLFASQVVQPTRDALARGLRRLGPRLDADTVALCVQSVIGQLLHVRNLQHLVASKKGAEGGPAFELTEFVGHVVRFSAAAIRELESRSPQPHDSSNRRDVSHAVT